MSESRTALPKELHADAMARKLTATVRRLREKGLLDAEIEASCYVGVISAAMKQALVLVRERFAYSEMSASRLRQLNEWIEAL